MYCIEVVDSRNIDFYRNINPDIASRLFSLIPANVDYNVTLAFFFGQIVGMALVEDSGYKSRWQLKWVFVPPKYRRIGIAKAMLNKLEDEAVKKGAKMLFTVLQQNASNIDPIQSLLEDSGYEPPKPAFTVYRSLCREICDNIYWIKEYPVKELYESDTVRQGEFELFKWNLLNEEDVRYLNSGVEREFPYWVCPLGRDEHIRKDISIGIRHFGRLIGWVVTEHNGEDELYFRASFIKEEYRGTKLYVMVFATILQLQEREGIKYTTTHVSSDNKRMLRFMGHAFENRFENVSYQVRMVKNLPD